MKEQISQLKLILLFNWAGLWGYPNNDEDVVGIIGQEVEAVFPYAIKKGTDKLYPDSESSEIIMYDIAAITFLMLNSVKELKLEIDKLEKDIDELKK